MPATPTESRWVALLRAINLGKHRKVAMADLRSWLAEAGYDAVETYIQTGNVHLTSGLRSPDEVTDDLERLLAERCGFEVPVVVLTPVELQQARGEAEGLGVSAARRYVTFLKAPLPAAAAAQVDAWSAPGEGARVVGRHVHWWLDHPTQAARLSNARLEKGGAVGTTRDLKVVRTLAERWGA